MSPQDVENSRMRLSAAPRSASCVTALWVLLDSEAGKRRLLSVEIPVIERYNDGRDPAFKISSSALGSTLVLRYRLKPGITSTRWKRVWSPAIRRCRRKRGC